MGEFKKLTRTSANWTKAYPHEVRDARSLVMRIFLTPLPSRISFPARPVIVPSEAMMSSSLVSGSSPRRSRIWVGAEPMSRVPSLT